jgi:hypothetical protein
MALLMLCAGPVVGQTWTPPRTPWGDPDLQGDYSNKYEQGTPFSALPSSRAATEDISGDELARLVKERRGSAAELPFTGAIRWRLCGSPAF